MTAKLGTLKAGDRVELLLHYAFEPGPRPQGTVVSVTPHGMVSVEMDRNGRGVRFKPSDLGIIPKRKPR